MRFTGRCLTEKLPLEVKNELKSFKVTIEMEKEEIEAEDEKKFRCTSWRISVKLKLWHFTGNKLIQTSYE